MVTRSEGYRRALGKEDRALVVVRDFIHAVLNMSGELIVSAERNRLHGDIDFGGCTAECKSQPIDPERYDQNFVEVMEDTSDLRRPHHADGVRRTAEILGLSELGLRQRSYNDYRTGHCVRRRVGPISHASCSLESIHGSAITIYANPDPARTFVYVYRRDFLLDKVRRRVTHNQMVRGKGNSNEDTFGVFVPNPAASWRRHRGIWAYCGSSSHQTVSLIQDLIRRQLTREGVDPS